MAHVLAKDLRAAVFQAGIQGKLTTQLNSDTSVKESLLDISTEKKKQIKEKLMKNEKLPSEINESEITLTIPESWQFVRLGYVVKLLSGQDLTPDRYSDKPNGIPYITGASNFYDGSIVINRYTLSPTSVALKGDLLITCKGTVGELAYLKAEKAHIARQIMSISTIGNVNLQYVELLLRNFIETLKAKAKSIIPGIDRKTILNLVVPFPPIEEQQRIVDRVNELMAKIDEYEKLENQLAQLKEQFPKDMRDSLLQAAMSGKLTCYEDGDTNIDTYIEDLVKNKEKNVKSKKWKKEFSVEHIDNSSFEYSLGNNWKWCYLGDICAIRGGKRVPVGRKLSEEPTSQKYIRVADMKNHSVISNTIKYLPDDLIEKLALYTISKNDLYITVAGTIGDVGVVPNELDGANLTENADKIIFENIDKQWLMTCLLSNVVQRQINEATTQVGQPKLAIKRIQSLSIPLCPLEEQKRIVEKLDKMLPLVDALAQMD